ncbi:MAG TPA: alanine--glyoxylate aminotransferase family protein, partial [Gemmatimonadaceae bacterium]|nr:alanine--glyoxylate aminotransferase family protein [Gemmatimonadaceae bacterium]
DDGTFFLPGPTEVRPEILREMARPMLPHRSAAFEAEYARCDAGLRQVFRTARPVYIASASATGLMEGAIRCAPHGVVLSLVNGAFSERFAQVAASCGRSVVRDDVALGLHHTPQQVASLLESSGARVVTLTHSETSTGALNDIEAIARVVHAAGAVILVDSVTGVAGGRLETDAWNIDFAFTGSQKALAIPPGLALGVASQAFIDGAASNADRGTYFDLVEFEKYAVKNQTPNTPAISLFFALAAQMDCIAAEGMDARWARHLAMQSVTLAWVDELRAAVDPSFDVLAPVSGRSPTVTCVTLPEGLSGTRVAAGVAKAGFVIGAGYGALRDTTIRIGHMGDHTERGLSRCLDVVRGVLIEQLSARR